MSDKRGRVLVIDDDRATCDVLQDGLSHRGFAIESATKPDAAATRIATDGGFDAVLTDLRMGQASGLDLVRRVHETDPDLPVIVITAFGSVQSAVEAIRGGAYDFITKPFEMDAVALALDRAIATRALRLEVSRLREQVERDDAATHPFGESAPMRRIEDLIARVADLDTTLLVTGESGTGKELVARAVHDRGARHAEPFVALNCAAVPEALLESELFGHVKGAFTDARGARAGLFVEAGRGTLFLDEIGEMPPAMQVKLLRALQERTVRPVGSDREVVIEARVVAATHRDLEADVASGRFRRDLFFRLAVIEIAVPPLRARGSDVLLLAQRFVARFAERFRRPDLRLSPAAAELLLRYDWPGNVRELENSMERSCALARGDEIGVDDLPDRVKSAGRPGVLLSADEPSDLVPLEEIERRYVLRVLEAVRGNKTVAAEILGLDRSTLYRKLERYGVEGSGG